MFKTKKDENLIGLKKVKREAKKRQVKEAIKKNVDKTYDWIMDNKELAMLIGTASVTAIKGGTKITTKAMQNRKLKKEQELKDLYVYDRSLGIYHRLKRPLTSQDAISITEKRADGTSLVVALKELNVL